MTNLYPELKKDEELALKFIQNYSGNDINNVLNIYEEVEDAVAHIEKVLNRVPDELTENSEFMKKVIRENIFTIGAISEEMREELLNDEKFVNEIVDAIIIFYDKDIYLDEDLGISEDDKKWHIMARATDKDAWKYDDWWPSFGDDEIDEAIAVLYYEWDRMDPELYTNKEIQSVIVELWYGKAVDEKEFEWLLEHNIKEELGDDTENVGLIKKWSEDPEVQKYIVDRDVDKYMEMYDLDISKIRKELGIEEKIEELRKKIDEEKRYSSSEIAEAIDTREGEIQEILNETNELARENDKEEIIEQEGQTQGDE